MKLNESARTVLSQIQEEVSAGQVTDYKKHGLDFGDKCSCGEPHVSDRIQHCYDGKPCYVKGSELQEENELVV